MATTGASRGVVRGAKTFLIELDRWGKMQARTMSFCDPTVTRFLTREGYIKVVTIEGYVGYEMNQKGKTFLNYLKGN
jgi:hypothetical protein